MRLLVVISALLCCLLAASAGASRAVPAPRYSLNLDLEPQDRWTNILSGYKDDLKALYKYMKELVGSDFLFLVSILGGGADKFIPHPYREEMEGVASAGDVSLGEVVLANVIYEMTAFNKSRLLDSGKACTSIVAEAVNGTIYHGRNLDYSLATVLRNLTITVDFQSGGKTLYTGTTYAGIVGLFTGQRPHAYTISLNERDKGVWWQNILEALSKGTNSIASFLIRDILGDSTLSFDDAVDSLSYRPLIAPCYLIIGGLGNNEGAVITRKRTQDLDIWRLDAENGEWFLVETNYDHWTPPPPSDDRRDPAIKAMNEAGRGNVSASTLYHVLSTPPVLNNNTAFTVTMAASIPEIYNTWIRYP